MFMLTTFFISRLEAFTSHVVLCTRDTSHVVLCTRDFVRTIAFTSHVVEVVVAVVVGQTVGSISSRTQAYDCLCTLELCTASMIATS